VQRHRVRQAVQDGTVPRLGMFLSVCFHFQVSHQCVLILCRPFLTEMHLILFFRTYLKKRAHFSLKKSGKPHAMERASAFLDNAARLWETKMCVVIEGYEAKRRSGAISSAVSEELIVGAAMQQAYFAQAQSMVNGNLSPHQVQEFDQLIRDAQHPNGSTWTEKYGNLALSRDQTLSHAAEQRSQNTHLEGTATARASASRPSSFESNGEAIVVAPVAHFCQEKRPTFDIFAPNVGLGMKLPKRKKRGIDMIWDCVFAANALDLSLHKPCSELNSEEKMARKVATKTRGKMEATEAAGLSSNCVKEILACKQVPFSQVSDFLSGRVTDKRGDNFCSQEALLMMRNQLDDDSSDNK
jgi:hypothetical protein